MPDLDKSLLDAAARGDLDAIKAALAQGAKVNAKDDHAKTALHLVTANRELHNRFAVAKFLIQVGADLYAKDFGDATPLRYLTEEEAEDLQETYTQTGHQHGDSGFRLFSEGSVQNACQLDKIQGVDKIARLRKGIVLAGSWPDTAVAPLRSDYPGSENDKTLCDYHQANGVPVVSLKLKTFLAREQSEGIEFLPVKIVDRKGAVIGENYFAVNPLAYECLDHEHSEPRFSSNGTVIRQVKRLVIDGSKLPKSVKIFRIANYREPVMVRMDLAQTIGKGSFTNVGFSEPRR